MNLSQALKFRNKLEESIVPIFCSGHEQIAELLIRYGANTSAVGLSWNTPLHIAAWQGSIQFKSINFSIRME